ncbi:hypothetical protein ACEPAF_5657 [Sanghuangporus sanghuang]|uniref:Hydrophobin n=1 Tax=Sanghuangporus baumii TaxID=108892 RepID=A0A9Q5I1A8_SANBA|nr:hypothetical protein A7U60_g3414 [Sanghuangporus baumii]
MQFFSKIAIVAMFTASVAATPITETDKRQLSGIPSIVCLTGPLGDIGSSIIDGSGIGIIGCPSDETCTALDIPIIGELLPIGVSLAADSHKARHELINLL